MGWRRVEREQNCKQECGKWTEGQTDRPLRRSSYKWGDGMAWSHLARDVNKQLLFLTRQWICVCVCVCVCVCMFRKVMEIFWRREKILCFKKDSASWCQWVLLLLLRRRRHYHHHHHHHLSVAVQQRHYGVLWSLHAVSCFTDFTALIASSQLLVFRP